MKKLYLILCLMATVILTSCAMYAQPIDSYQTVTYLYNGQTVIVVDGIYYYDNIWIDRYHRMPVPRDCWHLITPHYHHHPGNHPGNVHMGNPGRRGGGYGNNRPDDRFRGGVTQPGRGNTQRGGFSNSSSRVTTTPQRNNTTLPRNGGSNYRPSSSTPRGFGSGAPTRGGGAPSGRGGRR